jgi:hypothetical protein
MLLHLVPTRTAVTLDPFTDTSQVFFLSKKRKIEIGIICTALDHADVLGHHMFKVYSGT